MPRLGRTLDAMGTTTRVLAVSMALATGALIAPGFALGHQVQGLPNNGLVVGGATLGTSRSVAVPFPDQSFVSRSSVRSFVRPFFPFAVVAATPALVYAAPSVYYAPPVYVEPPVSYRAPVSYGPPVSYAPPQSPTVSVAPAPMPNVVQFSTGRYELRGDGLSIPYTWVWIPNAPTAPPPAATPSPSTRPMEETTAGRPSTPRRSQLYRWTDAQGAEHWTDRLDAVPEQYRSRAKHATSS